MSGSGCKKAMDIHMAYKEMTPLEFKKISNNFFILVLEFWMAILVIIIRCMLMYQ